MAFEHAGWLALLPLALLPLLARPADAARDVPWLALAPPDALSRAADWALRLAAALALAATACALARPYRPEASVERIGRGAEIVFVFDRSSSMDNPMTGRAGRRLPGDSADENAKATVARRILARFVRERDHDAFALLLFAAQPIAFLPFTQKAEVVLAAIDAASIGRGLGSTDIGRALLAATDAFAGRPYAGSRVIVLVSDGGAQLDEDTRTRLAAALRRQRVGLWWIYLRGAYGREIVLDGSLSAGEVAALPEQSLHEYFSGLRLPYHVYAAERAEAVQRAIDDLAASEQQPIVYTEQLPRRDLTGAFAGAALAALLVLLAARIRLAGVAA